VRVLWQAALVYLLIGVVYVIYQNLMPGGPADQVFGPGWWNPANWWSWFVLPILTWPILVWQIVK
jgi:hypothetical protein